MADEGKQVLGATRSPLITAVPGARILQVDEDGLTPVTWDDLRTVRDWRFVLDAPERFLRRVLRPVRSVSAECGSSSCRDGPRHASSDTYGGPMVLAQIAGLAVRSWGDPAPEEPVVLALHGLTSTSAVWADLAARLDVPVVAPDLPGRGSSVAATAGPGLPGLAREVVRTVDQLGLRRVVVVGHSMGAFLAPLVVDGLGDRVLGTVLLDGGVPPERSMLLTPLVVRGIFGLQTRRLIRHWDDVDSFTAAAEGSAGANRPDLRDGLRAWSHAVLRPEGDGFRPNLDGRRLVADAVDSLTRTPHLATLSTGPAPVHLIAAAHGADDARPPFLSGNAIAAGSRVVPRLTWERVEANHATMLFDPAAAAAVWELLRSSGRPGN